MKKAMVGALCGGALLLAGCATTGNSSAASAAKSAGDSGEAAVQAGQYTLVVNGYDWGPGADKVIINLGRSVSASEVSAEDFAVAVQMPALDWSTFSVVDAEGTRTVTAAYVSDENGTAIKGAGSFVTLELAVHPADSFSNPFLFNTNMMNDWADPYTLTITNDTLGFETADCAGRVSPLADQFTLGTHTADGITLSYAAWEPAKHGSKVPLVIWLHGMGEGGTDPYVALLGNKVVNLITPEIQKCFGADGAYVLAPQADGFWLQTDESKEMKAANEDGEAVSYYTKSLFDLIDTFVKENPAIDPNRVYIGGCSNGGYMTVNMVIEYPDYFAAAWPVCEAYPDSKIDDEKLANLAQNHIWFTQAKNDTTVVPEGFDVATVARLNELYPDADIHFTFWDDVHDTTGLYKGEDGEPYQYMGHWSWLYALNNECVDGGVTLMDWLAAQSR